MESIFKDVNSKNINEYYHSIEKCILNLSSIYFILDSYKIIRKNPEEGITLLNAQLDGISKTIESEKSYQLFCELIRAEFYVGDEPKEKIPLFHLIKGINENSYPYYPWQNNESNTLMYKDKVELSYVNDLENTKNKTVEKDNYLFEFEFDKVFLSIITEMKKFPRSREILHLYQNILLMKDFVIDKNFIKEFEDSFGEEDKKNQFFSFFNKKIKEAAKKGGTLFENFPIQIFSQSYKDSSKEDKEEFLKFVMNRPRDLFLAHFYSAGLNLSKKLNLNSISEINELTYRQLQVKLIFFSQKLLQIKNQFESTLNEINNYYKYKDDRERELNELIKDVLTFFKNRDFDWEKNKFPTSRKLSSMRPGGPGILKRINKFDGLNSFKLCFFEYIRNIKEKKYIESYVNPAPTTQNASEKLEKKNSEQVNINKINKL